MGWWEVKMVAGGRIAFEMGWSRKFQVLILLCSLSSQATQTPPPNTFVCLLHWLVSMTSPLISLPSLRVLR